MATVLATPDPTTGSMLVEVEQTIARDLFTRVVAASWGNATTGQAWVISGGAAADFSVNGTQGVISNASLAVQRITHLPTLSTDHDFTIQWISPAATPTGGNFQPGVIARFVDASNFYCAQLDVAPSGTVTLTLFKRVLAVNTTLAVATLATTHAGSAVYGIRIAACGNQISAKAWNSTVSEPEWMVTAVDNDLALGTRAGTRSILGAGVTNVLPVVWQYDNMVTIVGDPVRLFRVVNGVATEVRGSPFSTDFQTAAANTATAIFWDNEGPFDVSTEYILTSNCSPDEIASSGPVTLDSNDNAWLRDPVDPTLNVVINLEGWFDDCIDQDIVVLSRLGNPSYPNASGVFDIIDNPRPNTISQVRKNFLSSLELTSFSLGDILNLEDIFGTGRILVLSIPVSSNFGWAQRTSGTDYITVLELSQSYVGADQGVTARAWTATFRLSPPPADTSGGGNGGNGIGGGGATYDDLAASVIGTDYNSLTASGFVYYQIAAGVGY